MSKLIGRQLYITDFVEDLNYQGVILYVDPEKVNLKKLRSKLEHDHTNHLYRFEYMLKKSKPDRRNFFFIENCDFQDLDSGIHEYIIDGGYSVHTLQQDGDEFYINVNVL